MASPEYVSSIPGGLKNAVDWLGSSETLVSKPIALSHGSHRSDDMLDQLRIVLGAVSSRARYQACPG
ncbi:NADPH-dependent FMN reductase [Cypionkella sp.]|uniref:NADPH-dependent FMN reductase n=1 Tax=Cypionkella sp. TaxID=2811411 RepID=UPI00351D9FEF